MAKCKALTGSLAHTYTHHHHIPWLFVLTFIPSLSACTCSRASPYFCRRVLYYHHASSFISIDCHLAVIRKQHHLLVFTIS